ncbi:unnamed protein product [Cercopithifilaria johnstoni]|uniref:G-protein coupled receptors family 1 profile domain-containing protein n=1 Tax=Cercopithifilaria johnstoni TaxID=2874296 RepID=A0A8J2MEV3_9BILA|nr:unnamed protein product [Cercopithifilaria johnstoni]
MDHSYCIIVLFLISPLNCHEENTTDIFDIRDDYNMSKKYVAIISFSLLLLYGIVGNILLAALFCSRDNLYSRPFIFIAFQIIICSFLNFFSQIIVVIPGILESEKSDSYMSVLIQRIFASMNTLSFFGLLNFTFLLAVNRFVAISSPKYNDFFESIKFYFLAISVWISLLGFSVLEFNYCIKTFNIPNLQWYLNCSKNTSETAKLLKTIRYLWTLGLPIAMFAIYVAIFRSIRRKRKNVLELCKASGCKATITSKYERLMLIHSVIICAALEIEIICFYFLLNIAVKLAGKEAEIPVNIFINCYVIFNGAVLPTANLIFVKRFRNRINQAAVEFLSKITNKKRTDTTPATVARS